MKKEKRTVQVLRQMSEGDIKNLGGNLWMKRNAKWLILAGVLSFAWLVAGAVILEGKIGATVSVFPMFVCFLVWTICLIKEGKKLWNYVKDREQPVDLG